VRKKGRTLHDEQDTRAKLACFAQQLRELSFPTSTISIDLAEFVASALESYCTGGTKSLDASFGLTPKRGAPGDPTKREAIARKIFAMRLSEMSWKEIADAFSAQGSNVTDERTLRRIYDEFDVKIMREELCRRLAPNSGA